jgi:hypothetical protein
MNETTQANELKELKQLSEPNSLEKWQTNLMPLMKKMIIGLAIFFFVASFFQLFYLHTVIEKSPEISTDQIFSLYKKFENAGNYEKLEATRLKAEIILEENTIARRYHEASVLLMSGIWVRYMGFATGMILAIVGAVFILGKLDISQTDVGGKFQGNEISIKSSSPGIILATLGTLLMFITIVMQQQHNVNDASVYLGRGQVSGLGLDSMEIKPAEGKPSFIWPSKKDSSSLLKDQTKKSEKPVFNN